MQSLSLIKNLSDLFSGIYKGESGIKIKEYHKGRFTEYCNGNVTEECINRGKRSNNPAIRKQATFAKNARGWARKHQTGGTINPDIFVSYRYKPINESFNVAPQIERPSTIPFNTPDQSPSVTQSTIDWNSYKWRPSPIVIEQSTQSISPQKTIRFLGKDVDLKSSIDIILSNLNKQNKHTCTRAVANALKGEADHTKASGIANPENMYKQLKKDGWVDVYSENYVPQEGDIYTAWDMGPGQNDMHTSIFTNQKGFVSYGQDNPNNNGQTPWFWNRRNKENSKVHIMRYVG